MRWGCDTLISFSWLCHCNWQNNCTTEQVLKWVRLCTMSSSIVQQIYGLHAWQSPKIMAKTNVKLSVSFKGMRNSCTFCPTVYLTVPHTTVMFPCYGTFCMFSQKFWRTSRCFLCFFCMVFVFARHNIIERKWQWAWHPKFYTIHSQTFVLKQKWLLHEFMWLGQIHVPGTLIKKPHIECCIALYCM